MNPKLEQLRKRYANPSAPPDASGVNTLGARSITADHNEQHPTINDTNADTSSSVSQGPAPIAALAEQNRNDRQSAVEEPQPTNLARHVTAFFEPARRYRDRVSLSSEATRALSAELDVLAQSVEPLKGMQIGSSKSSIPSERSLPTWRCH